MAIATQFSYSIRDESGSDATNLIYVAYDGATETVDALIGAWLQYGALLDAVTGGVIKGGRILIPLEPAGAWKDATAVDVDDEKSLLMNFRVTGLADKYPQPVLVPAMRGSMINSNGQPNIADPAVAALIAAIDGSTGLGTVTVNAKQLADLVGLRDAAITFRKVPGSLSKTRVRP